MKKQQLLKVKLNQVSKKLIDKTLIAISGGQDSLYLIKLITELLNKNNIKINKRNRISYIYVDHQWRKDSYAQIRHIINYVKLANANIYIYQLNKKIMSEKISRIYRYHIIFKHAIKHKYKTIVTGHSKTDKIETFLQNFFRGYGIEGITSLISSVKLNPNIYLLRPLLDTERTTIYWICKKFCLPIWSDTTNYLYSICRNRIRYELVPYLKNYFHINIEKNINYLLMHYYINNEYIKQNTMKLYLNLLNMRYIAINHKKLRQQNFILQFKTLQLFCVHNTNINPNYNTIIKLLLNINRQLYPLHLKIKLKYLTVNVNAKWIYLTL